MAHEFLLHVLAIGLHDRPGAVHSVAEVFSGRGLQMEAFHGTAGSQAPDGDARALILFRATPERADLVLRVLRRLSVVRSAELLAAEDPRLIQSLPIAALAGKPPEGIALASLADGVQLAVGTPSAVQAWLASPDAPRRLGALRLEWMGLPGGS